MSPKHSRLWNVIQNIFAGYILFRNIYEIIKYILLGKYTIFPFIFPSRRENKGENRNVHNRNFWLFVKILKKICQQKIFVNMKVCAKGCCVQKNFFVCNNMSEHNVRSETKQCYACVWSHKKKLGNFCCSIVPLNVNSNKLSEANHIEAMWITYIMMYASDNFLDHPKNLPCCIHHDGTRRVANSLRTILASSY